MEMRDIQGFEGLYAVTDDGRVWSYPKDTPVGSNGGVRKDGGRWLKLNEHRGKGRSSHSVYYRVHLAKNGPHAMLVHRLVADAFVPNPENLPFVNHLDGNPRNNLVQNLEWCDAQRNSQHAFSSGLTFLPDVRGTRNGSAVLNEDTVRAIRKLYAETGNATATARAIGVTRAAVRGVVKCGYWSHVV